jgi:hypothetical protein
MPTIPSLRRERGTMTPRMRLLTPALWPALEDLFGDRAGQQAFAGA